MSFVPAPQAIAANAASGSANNAPVNNSSGAAPAAEGEAENLLFKLRTYDIYWVEKSALMYRDGFDKVSWSLSCRIGECVKKCMFCYLLVIQLTNVIFVLKLR
jgi:hypothetical protein